MKKIIILLLIVLGISSCQEYGKQETNPDDRYVYLIEMLEEHDDFATSSNYFDLNADMSRIEGGYRYYVTVDNPRIAMYDVEVLVIEKGVDYLSTMAANVGIFEEKQYNLVPNQSNPSAGFVKGVVASGVSENASTTLYIFVQFKNADYTTTHAEYFKLDVQYEG